MKKKILIAAVVILLLLVAALLVILLVPSQVTGAPSVVAAPVDGTVTSEGMSYQLINASEKDVFFGAEYSIEKNGLFGWREARVILAASWNAVAYSVPADSTRELEVNWNALYGALSPGEYRLIKTLTVNGEEYTIAVEFTVS